MNTSQREHRLYERLSPRLPAYDYTEPGAYFVTVCTQKRRCLFGEVIEGRMALSRVGEVVERCWMAIPEHFQCARIHLHQVMPNHVHGIIEVNHVGAQHAAPLHKGVRRPAPGSLGAIVRSFKSAVTKAVHEEGVVLNCRLWQRSFYDRIIRDDREQFFIEQYISLNPMIWHFDRNNTGARRWTPDALRKELSQHPGLDEYTIERLVEQSAW
jgi:putative transposase